jgi:hypothetical protein
LRQERFAAFSLASNSIKVMRQEFDARSTRASTKSGIHESFTFKRIPA